MTSTRTTQGPDVPYVSAHPVPGHFGIGDHKHAALKPLRRRGTF